MLYWLRENCYHLHITAIKPSENHVNRGSLVEKVVVFHCNLPIVGDFNCYVDNTGDSDFIKFNRIAELINLKQHDNCSTHIKGHTLVLNLRPPPPPLPDPRTVCYNVSPRREYCSAHQISFKMPLNLRKGRPTLLELSSP